MSIESTVQQKGIDMLIDTNPTTITIDREGYTIANGVRTQVETTVGPFNIALYAKMPTPIAVQVVSDAVRMDRVTWSALAKSTADIQSGGTVHDTFTVTGQGKFRLQNVVFIQTHGVVTGKLLILEQMK